MNAEHDEDVTPLMILDELKSIKKDIIDSVPR